MSKNEWYWRIKTEAYVDRVYMRGEGGMWARKVLRTWGDNLRRHNGDRHLFRRFHGVRI